jgi:hypothetical protein
MDKLDRAVVDHLEWRLLDPARLTTMMDQLLERREEWNERRRGHIAELRKRAAEAEAKLKRLYEAIENGVVDMADPSLKDRIAELTAVRDQAQADAERATSAVERLGPARATCRGGRSEPNPHPWHENRTATDTCRRRGRRIGGWWRSQFYTEVARPERFEIPTSDSKRGAPLSVRNAINRRSVPTPCHLILILDARRWPREISEIFGDFCRNLVGSKQ